MVNDVPLIVEAGIADRYDVVVVVDAPVELQLDRLTRLRGMAEDDARARIAAQASREQRLAIADHVIVNDGDLDSARRRRSARSGRQLSGGRRPRRVEASERSAGKCQRPRRTF